MHQKNKIFLFVFFLTSIVFFPQASYPFSLKKAFNMDKEAVKGKLFEKSGKVEFIVPQAGMLLNQSLINSYVLSGSMSYFTSEEWGLFLDGSYFLNSDKIERQCLESRINDSFGNLSVSCALPGTDKTALLQNPDGTAVNGANYGPVYLGVREIQWMSAAGLVWNPIYGKQIAFLSFMSYFDIYSKVGFGLANVLDYPESQYIGGNQMQQSTGVLASDFKAGCPKNFGICPTDANFEEFIGTAGRPAPSLNTIFYNSLSFGQKLHFKERFLLSLDFSVYFLYGGLKNFDTVMSVNGGFGFRL